MFSHICDQYIFFQLHLSKVLNSVRFSSATLLHSLKILHLLTVRVPELRYRDLKKILHYGGKHGECCVLVCAQEQDLCVHRNRTCVCTGTGLVSAQEQDLCVRRNRTCVCTGTELVSAQEQDLCVHRNRTCVCTGTELVCTQEQYLCVHRNKTSSVNTRKRN